MTKWATQIAADSSQWFARLCSRTRLRLLSFHSLANVVFLSIFIWTATLHTVSWFLEDAKIFISETLNAATKEFHYSSLIDASDVKIALVLPYVNSDTNEMIKTISNWQSVHDACSSAYQRKVGLFLYNNLDEQSQSSSRRKQIENDIAHVCASYYISGCFAEIRTIYAELKPEEDGYPEGPSVMFFKLMLEKRLRDDALGGYTHVMWMEWDTRPIRSLWLDSIVRTALEGGGESFWIRGSMYHGKGFDGTVMYKENRDWVGHINGNALYYIRDAAFQTFLQLVLEREPPTDYWRPFDVSMYRVLNDFPYSWRTYQAYSHKFQYKSFVRHTSFHKGNGREKWPEDLYLVHGDQNSAGNAGYFKKFNEMGLPTTNETLYGYEVRPRARLSVLVQTFEGDLDFAAVALRSAKRYIPYALEYVAVVPETDLRAAKEKIPKFVVLHGEPQTVLQKYTKLNADKYCKGDFILHLDSDVVFFRTVNYKDLFLFGKPMLEFDSYENLNGLNDVHYWQEGTAYALGRPVEYEYSRSNVHVYPRDVYPAARTFLENKFNMPLVDFLKTRRGSLSDLLKYFNWTVKTEDLDKSSLFSESNFMGAFLHFNMPDAISWRFVGTEGVSPFNEDVFHQVIGLPFTCQGNARYTDDANDIHEHARKDYHSEKRGELLKLFNDIADGITTNCYALQWVLNNQ